MSWAPRRTQRNIHHQPKHIKRSSLIIDGYSLPDQRQALPFGLTDSCWILFCVGMWNPATNLQPELPQMTQLFLPSRHRKRASHTELDPYRGAHNSMKSLKKTLLISIALLATGAFAGQYPTRPSPGSAQSGQMPQSQSPAQ